MSGGMVRQAHRRWAANRPTARRRSPPPPHLPQTAGLLIGATVMVAKTAQTVAAVMMLTFMLVGE